MTQEEYKKWLKEMIAKCENSAKNFREQKMQVSSISSEAMAIAYKGALFNFEKIK